jgi:hypothetical protein
MAVKTFGSEIMTSGDVNTYLANSGLVYVTSQTVGTAVSSVTVTGCFTSTYDNYRITYSGGVGSTVADYRVIFDSVTSGYYGSIVYCSYSTSAAAAIGTNNGASAQYCGGGDTAFACLEGDVFAPFLTRPTVIFGPVQNNSVGGHFSYRLNDTLSHSSFTITPSTGTLTGGTITVYGYRKA